MSDTTSVPTFPQTDPTSLFEHFRGSYGSELLTAAVAHLGVFTALAEGPLIEQTLQTRLGLAQRPLVVLLTALRAMGLITKDEANRYQLTELSAEHLSPRGLFPVADYLGLAANSPGVLEMVARLRSNRPAHAESTDTGAAFIYREGLASAMEQEESARRLTLALAGRARNVAPYLARQIGLESGILLDLGGGTGIYSIACLLQSPLLTAIVLDRPEVLKVAAEFSREAGVEERLRLLPGDMFDGPLPPADSILLSNILHDWDEPQCLQLIRRCAAALPSGGRLIIHDVFLNDALDGPLPIALYSAALFTLTEGRAYSAGEYRHWMRQCGLEPSETVLPTLIHCGLLASTKP